MRLRLFRNGIRGPLGLFMEPVQIRQTSNRFRQEDALSRCMKGTRIFPPNRAASLTPRGLLARHCVRRQLERLSFDHSGESTN